MSILRFVGPALGFTLVAATPATIASTTRSRTLYLYGDITYTADFQGGVASIGSTQMPVSTPILVSVPAGATVSLFSMAGGAVAVHEVKMSS